MISPHARRPPGGEALAGSGDVTNGRLADAIAVARNVAEKAGVG
jgi:hypothetical protein